MVFALRTVTPPVFGLFPPPFGLEPAPPDPDPDPDPLPASPSVKGLLSFATLACVRSMLKVTVSSCWIMRAFRSVVAKEEPDLQAPTQPEDVLSSDMEPALQVSQLEHRTLATIVPSLTPLPSRRVNCAAVLLVSSEGVVCWVPRRGDSVIFPLPSWYMTKRLESDIIDPVPKDTQESEVGARIWK